MWINFKDDHAILGVQELGKGIIRKHHMIVSMGKFMESFASPSRLYGGERLHSNIFYYLAKFVWITMKRAVIYVYAILLVWITWASLVWGEFLCN